MVSNCVLCDWSFRTSVSVIDNVWVSVHERVSMSVSVILIWYWYGVSVDASVIVNSCVLCDWSFRSSVSVIYNVWVSVYESVSVSVSVILIWYWHGVSVDASVIVSSCVLCDWSFRSSVSVIDNVWVSVHETVLVSVSVILLQSHSMSMLVLYNQ